MWNLINAETCVQTRSQRTEQHKRCWRGQDRRVVVILPRGGRVRCPENQKPGQQSRRLVPLIARSCPQRPRHVSCRFQRHVFVKPSPAANCKVANRATGNSRSCLRLNTPLRLSSPTVRCDCKEKASADAISPLSTCMGWREFQNRRTRALAAWTRPYSRLPLFWCRWPVSSEAVSTRGEAGE
jgi:hypothetical protein